MIRTFEACCCVCAVLVTLGEAARADEPAAAEAEGETIVVIDRAPERGDAEHARDRERALGDAPFVTILHPDDHPATASVADALATSAGAQTRSLGGLGAYQSVSVRGAAAGHTAVLIDGIPLARIAEVTTDLGRYAMDSFGEVELYRGAVPLELGGAGVGGAVNLITRLGRGERGERFHASIGGGSFGARHVRLRYADDHRRGLQSSTTLSYQGATGDYGYFTDGGTPLNPGDDGYLVRRNNHFDQIDLATRGGFARRALTGGLRLSWKHQGLPGSIAQPASEAEMTTLDAIADVRGDTRLGSLLGRQLGYLLVEHQRLDDPAGELGLGAQRRGYATISAGASSSWTRALGAHRASAGIELRGDGFSDEDRDGERARLLGTRLGAAALFSGDLALASALVVTPSLRLDAVRTDPTPMVVGPGALIEVPARHDLVPSPRLTVHARLAGDLAIKGSAGWYVRLPTLIELFGNRGAMVGSPGLRAERGPSSDVGVVWAPARAFGSGDRVLVDRVLVQAAGFASRARDTIAVISTAGFAARAENVGATLSYGGELVASARLARTLSLTASYTRLVTEQRTIDPNLFGKALPRTPGHLLYARADLARRFAGRLASLWLDVAAQSTSYLDPANFQRVPARALIGAGARVELVGGLAAALSVANLAGTRVVTIPGDRPIDPPTRTALSDLAGFPLPGRSFYLAFDWTH